MSKGTILLLIGAFLVLTVGSFAWFVATWDASAEDPVSALPAHHSVPNIPAGGVLT